MLLQARFCALDLLLGVLHCRLLLLIFIIQLFVQLEGFQQDQWDAFLMTYGIKILIKKQKELPQDLWLVARQVEIKRQCIVEHKWQQDLECYINSAQQVRLLLLVHFLQLLYILQLKDILITLKQFLELLLILEFLLDQQLVVGYQILMCEYQCMLVVCFELYATIQFMLIKIRKMTQVLVFTLQHLLGKKKLNLKYQNAPLELLVAELQLVSMQTQPGLIMQDLPFHQHIQRDKLKQSIWMIEMIALTNLQAINGQL